jgi:HK97 gp10 family phage protein
MSFQIKIDQKSVDQVIKTLEKLPVALRDDVRKKILRTAAKPMISAARSNIKDSVKNHSRYPRGQKKKSAKGQGKVIATYTPGNLRRSIGIIPLRKTANIYVGPRSKKDASGVYSGGRYDGYYGVFLEYGTKRISARPFMRPAYEATKDTVIKLIADGCRKAVDKYAKENGQSR